MVCSLQEEFPDYPELLRVAVSLGRRMQEPLMEFTSLMLSEDAEVLSLRLHPLQSSLPKDQLCKVTPQSPLPPSHHH